MLSRVLKELRRRNAITQAELADILGITQQAVARWESNKSEPDIETLKRLSSYFNVSTDYLLGQDNKDKNNFLSKEQTNLLRDYDSLSKDGQSLIKTLMTSLVLSHAKKASKVIKNNSGGNNFLNVGGINYATTI